MKPFEHENFYAGIPYRVLSDASVEALMPGGELARFMTVEQFLASANDLPKSDVPRGLTAKDANGGGAQGLPTSAGPLNYYTILVEAIKRTEQNSAQLRQLVYERARFNFKRDLLFGHSTLGLADIVRHINDFELAVARIEANAGNEAVRPQEPTSYAPPLTPVGADGEFHAPTVPIAPIYTTDESFREVQHSFGRRHSGFTIDGTSASLFRRISIVAIVFAGVVIGGTMLWYSSKVRMPLIVANELAKITTPPAIQNETKPQQSPAKPDTAPAPQTEAKVQQAPPKQVPFPLPGSFGIYALGNGQLTELHTLPIGVPDPRVALSAEFKQPSTVTLTDRSPAFILFRRDLLNNAPQTIALRVVASVARETKIVGGKATVTKIDGTWRIRNVSNEVKVSPIPGQPEMVIAHLADKVTLAPGRYALVLNRVGYDFTIAGAEQPLEFCLEGFETANGLIFNQCRVP